MQLIKMATVSGVSRTDNYCLCRKPYQDGEFMIECSICQNWFHGSCVKVTEGNVKFIDKYHCPTCQKTNGPLTLIKRYIACLDNDRENEAEEINSTQGKVRTGSAAFIQDLKQKIFLSADQLPVVCLEGHQVTIDYFEKNGFHNPILVDNIDGLNLQVPPSNFSIHKVEELVGSMTEIDVIDVSKQEDTRMFLREWIDYFTCPNKKPILNLLSLEFSNSKLAEIVNPPQIVYDLSWVSCHWPHHSVDSTYYKPEVQRYCLMSVKDSYTDFHIDFGGSSVWYHIVRGEKVFYLIPPTKENLLSYEKWMQSPQQHETFLADQVDVCYKAVIKAGQTVFLPSGWIHAVWTPIDSLVFGGNFLHSFNIDVQLEIYDLEHRIKAPEKYLFPNFQAIHWFAATYGLKKTLKDCLENNKGTPAYIVEGSRFLIPYLKQWAKNEDKKKNPIPYSIKPKKLLRDLDRYLNLLMVGPKQDEHGKKRYYANTETLGSPLKKKKKTSLNLGDFLK